jgi:hypothetical protein
LKPLRPLQKVDTAVANHTLYGKRAQVDTGKITNMKAVTKTHLIKLYHILCSKAGMNEQARKDFLSAWGVESSKDLNIVQLQEACRIIKDKVNSDTDKWRKRVIAAVFGWLKLTGRTTTDVGYVKAIACRSAGYKLFNEIPKPKLITLYYAFLDKQKVIKKTGDLISDDLDIMKFKN